MFEKHCVSTADFDFSTQRERIFAAGENPTFATNEPPRRVAFLLAAGIVPLSPNLLPKARVLVRIRRPKVGELAHQTQGKRIFAAGENPTIRMLCGALTRQSFAVGKIS